MTRKHGAAIASSLRLCLFLVIAVVAQACGGVSPSPPTCTGTTCACTAGATCDVTPQTCGASCSLACDKQSTCGGACGDSCSINCGEQASCTITLGDSGSISCKAGSTCQVTCVDSCSLSCADGASCELKCPADGVFHAVSGGASC